MNGLNVINVSKYFDSKAALSGVSFDVGIEDIVAILGPSGCGKSTLLSIIAGLIKPDQGEIFWKGESQEHILPHKRGFGLMFQDYMLFPHKNVYGNVAFGLEMLGWNKDRIENRVNEILEFVGILEYKFRDVSTLSGGEQQRTALARSLAPSPSLLLLDEPFSSLDRTLRDRLLDEMSIILKEMNQTSIYVTHDQEEAFALSNKVVVINDGRVQQIGHPEEIYMYPKNEFVARFLGFTNIFTAVIQNNQINFPFGSFQLNASGYPCQNVNPIGNQKKVRTLIRPEAIKIHSTGDQNLIIECRVRERNFRGNYCRLVVDTNGTNLSLNLPTTSTIPKENEKVTIFIDPQETIHYFETE